MSDTDILFLIAVALVFALIFTGAWAISAHLEHRAMERTDRRLR